MEQQKLVDIAKRAASQYSPSAHNRPSSSDCIAFFFDTEGHFIEVIEGEDVYIVLTLLGYVAYPQNARGIGIVSPGWLSPTGETSPKHHPERKEVELVTVLTTSFETASIVVVVETGDLLEQEGACSGPLLEAIGASLFRSIVSASESDLTEE